MGEEIRFFCEGLSSFKDSLGRVRCDSLFLLDRFILVTARRSGIERLSEDKLSAPDRSSKGSRMFVGGVLSGACTGSSGRNLLYY